MLLQNPEGASELEASLRGVAGENVGVECIAKGGNPAPRLVWYLDDMEVDGGLESEDREAGTVASILHIPVSRKDSGKKLRCVVEHEALQTEMEASIVLNIQCK